MSSCDLSVVIPVYNESPNLGDLHRELSDTLSAWGRSYELVFVDDGSTRRQLRDPVAPAGRRPAHAGHPVPPNFGQTAGFSAGFAVARGRSSSRRTATGRTTRATSRCSSNKLERGGFDIVCGWRRDRKDKWLTRRCRR
jgi:glycosyltransferase involved in cell wall biosynthesis